MNKSNFNTGCKRKNPDKQHSYNDIIFEKRPSTGRPGSPHRYFGDSYTVLFPTGDSTDSSGTHDCHQESRIDTSSAEQPSSNPETPKTSAGHQVIHRHLNGLCLITAGDILSQVKDASTISSVHYHVNISQMAQSSRGKIRAKKKTKKKLSDTVEDRGSDGIVEPMDVLCTIALNNGISYECKCCVAGTVLELNHRLISTNNGDVQQYVDQTNVLQSEGDRSVAPNDPSLLLTDPLLDGYLAVIMPRGAFPPGT